LTPARGWAFVCLGPLVGMESMSELGTEQDPRLRSAWRTWLSALAIDPEAAVAAALAYEALSPEGRDAWLDALALDIDDMHIRVPAVALYAPLLAVEPEEGRKARIGAALAARGQSITQAIRHERVRALCGRAPMGEHVCALLSPLYLDFVSVLVCRYRPERGVLAARRDPIRHVVDVVGRKLSDHGAGVESGEPDARTEPLVCTLDGISMAEAPLCDVVEDLAHAIVADRRQGRAAPEVFRAYAHLFVPNVGPSAPSTPPFPSDDRSGAA
jgi:hypothetical protein